MTNKCPFQAIRPLLMPISYPIMPRIYISGFILRNSVQIRQGGYIKVSKGAKT